MRSPMVLAASPLVRWLGLVAVIASLAGGSGGWRQSGSEAAPEAGLATSEGFEPGQVPPDFSATDLRGQPQSLRGAKDQVVILHFWASWCPYCRKEIPKLKQIQQQWGDKGVKILAVSVDEDVEKLQRFVRDNALPYPVIAEVNSGQPLATTFRVAGIPSTYLIDRHGMIVNHFEGQADLVSAVGRLMRESSRPAS